MNNSVSVVMATYNKNNLFPCTLESNKKVIKDLKNKI